MFLQPLALAPLSAGLLELKGLSKEQSAAVLHKSYAKTIFFQWEAGFENTLCIFNLLLGIKILEQSLGYHSDTLSINTTLKGNILALTWKGD